jgi:hypothetical protein
MAAGPKGLVPEKYPVQTTSIVTPLNRDNNNNNISILFFIIYVLSQQLLGQLQTQHSVDTVMVR